jgi:hypothetical protein
MIASACTGPRPHDSIPFGTHGSILAWVAGRGRGPVQTQLEHMRL